MGSQEYSILQRDTAGGSIAWDKESRRAVPWECNQNRKAPISVASHRDREARFTSFQDVVEYSCGSHHGAHCFGSSVCGRRSLPGSISANRRLEYQISHFSILSIAAGPIGEVNSVLPFSGHADKAQALNGAKHLEFLVKQNLLNPVSYPELEQLYAKRLSESLDNTHAEKPAPRMAEDVEQSEDRLLLQLPDAKKLATMLEAPELALEAERAIAQVEEKLEPRNRPQGGSGP